MPGLARIEQLGFRNPKIKFDLRHERSGIQLPAANLRVSTFQMLVRVLESPFAKQRVDEAQDTKTVVAMTRIPGIHIRHRITKMLLPSPQSIDQISLRDFIVGDPNFIEERKAASQQPKICMHHGLNAWIILIAQQTPEQVLSAAVFTQQPEAVRHPPSNRRSMLLNRPARPGRVRRLHQESEDSACDRGSAGPQGFRSSLKKKLIHFRPTSKRAPYEAMEFRRTRGLPKRLGDAHAGPT